MILDDYAAQREAEDAIAAGVDPIQAGARSVVALGHKTAMSTSGAAVAAYLARPTEPRVAYVPPKREP